MGRAVEAAPPPQPPSAPATTAGGVVGWARTAATAATSVLPSLLGGSGAQPRRGAGSSSRSAGAGGWEQLGLHEGVQVRRRPLTIAEASTASGGLPRPREEGT